MHGSDPERVAWVVSRLRTGTISVNGGAELAVRASAAVVANGGGPAILRDAMPALLARNATFTLVAASRPELKQSLVQRFSAIGFTADR